MYSILNLINNLNKLFVKLDKRYDINCGGCCYVAYLIARELEKRELYDFKLRIYNYSLEDYSVDNIRFNIINNKDRLPCRSCTVYHYSIVYDQYEINESDEGLDYLDIDNLYSNDIERLYHYGDWNDCYDTVNNIFVERFIKIIFNNYDKEIKAKQM